MRHRVVILGGGFAGVSAAHALHSADADVTLLDRRNFHLFQPLLYQVATGSLSPSDIASPLRAIFAHQRNVRVLMGDAQEIDAPAKTILLSDGMKLEYDTLIVAVGSITSYYGHNDWIADAQSIKSIEDATEMRRRIYTAFENAELEGPSAQNSPWLTFVIVGGGATGVELAGALSEIARKTLKDDFRSIRPEMAQLILVDQAPRILPAFSDKLAGKAEATLVKLGVRVRCGLKVTAITSNGVHLERPDRTAFEIPAKTVLWAGGVAVPEIVKQLAKSAQAPTDPRGRILVDASLTIPGHPEIFVAGDIAACKEKQHWLPGVAQVAMQQGSYAGRSIARRLQGKSAPPPFHYSDRGDMAVIGRASAVAKIFGFEVWGFPAWFVWAFIHILYLIEFQSRIIVLVRWAFQYLTFSRGARLITGDETREESKVGFHH
jgi:NADH dehydrogenase